MSDSQASSATQSSSLATRFKETLGHGAVYGLGESGVKLLGFLLIPLYTNHLAVSEYGALALLSIVGNIAAAFFRFGQNTALFASFYDEQTGGQKIVVSTAFYIVLAGAGFLFVAGWLVRFPLADLIFHDRSFASYLFAVLATKSVEILCSLATSVYRAKKWSKQFTTVNVASVLLRLGLILYLVAFQRLGLWGVLLGNLIASVVRLVVLYASIWDIIGLKFSGQEAKRLLEFGVPLIFSTFGGMTIEFADRVLLNEYGSLEEVGLYNLGYQMGTVMNMVLITPMNLIIPPMIFSVQKEAYAKEYYAKIVTYVSLVALLFALGISVMAKDAIRLMAEPAYWPGYRVVPVIALSYAVWAVTDVVGVGILLQRTTRRFAYTTLIGGVCNVVLNIALIPAYGMMGAAVATLLAFTVVGIGRYLWGQSLYRVEYEWVRLVKLLVVATGLYFLIAALPIENEFLALFVKGALSLTYPLLLFLTGFYNREERATISKYIARGRARVIKPQTWLNQ